MPYSVNDHVDKVITDADETFCIIIGMEARSILVFTEKDGFDEFHHSIFEEYFSKNSLNTFQLQTLLKPFSTHLRIK